MAYAIVTTVLEKLSPVIQKEIGLIWGVHREAKKLQSTLSTIQSVLEDAENKQLQLQDKAIKDWLRKLNSAAYEVDDILDDFATEANRSDEDRSGRNVLPSIIFEWMFRREIGKRMRDIGERLDEIAAERKKYHLREIPVEKRLELSKIRLTGSFVNEKQVYGRDVDKEKIVNFLINPPSDCEDISVYPITGMGGIGKTTLAQLVFNDERVTNHFKPRIWVCVSDDFDVQRLLKAIIETATGKACDVSDLDTLQRSLQEMLKGKTYLLVLDDVWNENQEKWVSLKSVLQCGARGASVVATTRLGKVAKIMGTLPKTQTHRLTGLSEDICQRLFEERAFGSEREEHHDDLVEIGKEIVKKCKGVPLAAKSLGSLMRFKRDKAEWVFVRDSEIWNLPQDENSILPALRLSYYHLPLEARRCFSFCATFEKDARIGKVNLIHLWMANGFISSSGENREMEDIGDEIWNELYLRSFFEDVEKDENLGEESTFKMHDLVHDLAQSVMDEECQIVEVDNDRPINMSNKRPRYQHLIACSKPLTTTPNQLQCVDFLRTLLYTEKNGYMNSSEFSVFEDYSRLRAFAAAHERAYDKTSITKVAPSIGRLKHLRYLRLQGARITELPDSICSLWNLQTLNLWRCSEIKRLPEKMSGLTNLRHLLIDECAYSIEFPPFMGKLTGLRTLYKFKVGKSRGCGIDELGSLNHLGGSLEIENLERVRNWMDAKKTNLIAKKRLRSLKLTWDEFVDDESQKNVEQLLESLQPTQNLQELRIYSYKGTCFPRWMSEYSNLKSIINLELLSCENCTKLPPLHKLPSLRKLFISDMKNVEWLINSDMGNEVESSSSNNAAVGGFPFLEELIIDFAPNLKVLLLSKENEEKWEGRVPPLFPRLRHLFISECPKLTIFPFLPASLESLQLYHDDEVTSIPKSIETLTSLEKLKICSCPNLVSIPDIKLQHLKIRDCPKLKLSREEILPHMHHLLIDF